MRSRRKTESVPQFDDDRSMWDRPFLPEDLRGLAEDTARQDALVRRLRLALPLEKRMNVLVTKRG
jgi:hypothetical protein